jgi:hypothetical protein
MKPSRFTEEQIIGIDGQRQSRGPWRPFVRGWEPTLQVQMGPMTGPVSLEDALRGKSRALAREVYWHSRSRSARNSKNATASIANNRRA